MDAPAPAGERGAPPAEAPLDRLVGRTYGEARAELLRRGYRPVARSDYCGDSAQCSEFPEADSCSQGIQRCTFRFVRNGAALSVTTSGESEDDAGAVIVSHIAEESGVAAAPAFPLTPLSDADVELYAGAGCDAAYRGRTVFVTDMQGATVRHAGRLVRMRRREASPRFDPDNEAHLKWVEGADPVGGIAVFFRRRPGPITPDPENESASRPMRITVAFAGSEMAAVDVTLTCGS